jgi:2-polyprenyl-3-methyl-5-hydroxy-6-metoxy-1,4-benzoquinol methylase
MKNSKRSSELELLDLGPSYYSKEEYEDCLYQLDRVGRLLGGNKATLDAFKKFQTPNTLLDVGCGGGHFTIELAKQFPKAKVVGIDISSEAIEFANKRLQETQLKNLTFELSLSPELSYPSNSFDAVTATLVCHHLQDHQLVDFFKRSYQIASKFIVINDLHRHWFASLGFGLIAGPLFSNRLISHDGLVSIRRAFKKQDWIDYLDAAEIPLEHCSITWHWPCRWMLCIDTSSKLKR